MRPGLIRSAPAALLALLVLGAPPAGADFPPDGGVDASPPPPASERKDPEVPPTSSRKVSVPLRAFVDLRVRLRAGDVTIDRARPGRHAVPVEQPLFRGRFVARVVPRALLPERPNAAALLALDEGAPASIPFDFPLLAEADAGEEQAMDAFLRDPSRVRADTTVRVPLPDDADGLRGLVAVVVDTKAGRAWTRPLPISPPSR